MAHNKVNPLSPNAFSEIESSADHESSNRQSAKHQSEAPSMLSEASSETRLSEMANLDLKYKNKCVQAWLHAPVGARLTFMLTTPFAALIILLVIVISNEVTTNSQASSVIVLAELVSNSLMTVAELSAEYTCSLWWILDQTLQSGITESTGGLKGSGLLGQYAATDVKMAPLRKLFKTSNLNGISQRLSDRVAVIEDTLQSLSDTRYAVRKFRMDKNAVTDFYVPLLESLLNTVDFTGTLADSKTIQTAQALVSWSRTKTAVERERHTVGMILLLNTFSMSLYTDWLEQVTVQAQWRARFLAIAPTTYRNRAQTFFNSPLIRMVEEMRLSGLAAFRVNNSDSLPNITFSEWMSSATNVVNYMRDFRTNVSSDIISMSTDTKQTATTALSLFILLAILAAFLSITISLLVTWSIVTPWNSMLRMKERMMEKLHDQERRDVIVNNFVPTEFFTMMGLKSLFDLQLGNCMLKRASVVCSDIRNFSKLSERMAPQQTFQFLSMWLQDSGPIIRRHNGFLEKFRGNGLTAVFHDPNDALDASLELLEVIQARNQEASNSSLQVECALAVHTGDLMMGTVGDQQRMETAIISEAIAVALLMIKLATLYESTLLVTKETFMVLNVEGLTSRFIGEAGLRGLKAHPQVYEILRSVDEHKMETLNEFNQAMKMHEEGRYPQAVELYQSVLEIDPGDVVANRRLAMAEKSEWVDFIA